MTIPRVSNLFKFFRKIQIVGRFLRMTDWYYKTMLKEMYEKVKANLQ